MTRDADALRGLAEELNVVRTMKRHGLEPAELKAILLRAARALAQDAAPGPGPSTEAPAAPDECSCLEREDLPAPASGAELIVHTDGASRGNPGPAAAGFVLYSAGRMVEAAGQYLGRQTSNQAEYNALILGLERARQLGAARVVVRCDSELMERQLNGRYRVKNAQLQPLFARVKELAAGFESFRVEHVPREQNAYADRMANRALDEFERDP